MSGLRAAGGGEGQVLWAVWGEAAEGTTDCHVDLLDDVSRFALIAHGKDANPGKHRNLTDGVSELKIDFGPGYRVCYTQRGTRLLLLLAGEDKSTQQDDIETAINLARNFQE